MAEITPTEREWLDRMAAAEDAVALKSIGIQRADITNTSESADEIKRTITSPTASDFFSGNINSGIGPQDSNLPANSG